MKTEKHTDGRRDTTKPTLTFQNIPKKSPQNIINKRIFKRVTFHILAVCLHTVTHSHTCCGISHIAVIFSYPYLDGFGGLVVRMLASGTQVRGFKPGGSRWIFTGLKILSMPSSGGEVKESVSCPSFAACKRT